MRTTTRRVDVSCDFAPCPVCRTRSKRHSTRDRRLRDIGKDGPAEILLTFSLHYCGKCRKHFTVSDRIASGSSKYTRRVRRAALDLVFKGGLDIPQTCHRMWQRYFVRLGASTVFDWKKTARREGERV